MPGTLTTLDLRRELKVYYTASKTRPALLFVPELSFLTIEGVGAPEGPEFQSAVQALYTSAYTLKFFVKQEQGLSYPVMPLEGLWRDASGGGFSMERRSSWAWTLLIAAPELVTEELLDVQRARCVAKAPAAGRVHVQRIAEGRVCQMLHVGPYATEPETVARMRSFIAENGLVPSGFHHEIYLSDPRRTPPERWRTILRQPVA